MNPAKYTDLEYIDFLIATQKAYSCSEAERVQPQTNNSPSHDAINRLLHRIEPEPKELWQEAKAYVELTTGVLVLDDPMMDKWFAKKIELVSRQWSGSIRDKLRRERSCQEGLRLRVKEKPSCLLVESGKGAIISFRFGFL